MSKTIDKSIMEEIRVEFLKLVEMNREGYYISLQTAFKWLENPDMYEKFISNIKYRENFIARNLRNPKYKLTESTDENDKSQDFIMRKIKTINNIKNIKMPWFSDEGFKTLCMALDLPKSYIVRKYFIQIEKDYMRVLKQTEEENKKELDDLHEKMNKYEGEYTLLKKDNEILNDKVIKYSGELCRLQPMIKQFSEMDEILADEELFLTTGSLDVKILNLLYKLFLTNHSIFIVNPDYIIQKKQVKTPKVSKVKKTSDEDMYSSEEDQNENKDEQNYSDSDDIFEDILEYDEEWRSYCLYDLNNRPDVEYYFNIQPYKSRVERSRETFSKVAELPILDKAHHTEMLNKMKTYPYAITSRKNVFRMSWGNMKDLHKSALSNRLVDMEKKMNKTAATKKV